MSTLPVDHSLETSDDDADRYTIDDITLESLAITNSLPTPEHLREIYASASMNRLNRAMERIIDSFTHKLTLEAKRTYGKCEISIGHRFFHQNFGIIDRSEFYRLAELTKQKLLSSNYIVSVKDDSYSGWARKTFTITY